MENYSYSLWESVRGIQSFRPDTKILNDEKPVQLTEHQFNFMDEKLGKPFWILFKMVIWEYVAFYEEVGNKIYFRLISEEVPPCMIKYIDHEGETKELNFKGRITKDFEYIDGRYSYSIGRNNGYLLEMRDDDFEERVKVDFPETAELYEIVNREEFKVEKLSKTKACR